MSVLHSMCARRSVVVVMLKIERGTMIGQLRPLFMGRDVSTEPSCRTSTNQGVDQYYLSAAQRDYLPVNNEFCQDRCSVNSLASLDQSTSSRKREKFTVPKPFAMTVRDDNRREEYKQKLQSIRTELAKAKEKSEMNELNKKFKARKVPRSTYKHPKLDAKSDSDSKKLIKVQPFSFHGRSKSTDKLYGKETILEGHRKTFRARPAPVYCANDTWIERKKEADHYRNKRIEIRSKELLSVSAYPSRMAAELDGDGDGGKEAKRLCRSFSVDSFSLKQRVWKEAPDFSRVHQVEASRLRRKSRPAYGTVCRPFQLATEERTRRRPASTSSSVQSSSRRATSQRSASLENVASRLFVPRRPRQVEVGPKAKTAINSNRLKRQLHMIRSELRQSENDLEKRRQIKQQQLKLRQRAYKRDLEDIDKRLKERPLLMERAALESQRRAAEKHFAHVLHQAGLSERVVRQLCATSPRPSPHTSHHASHHVMPHVSGDTAGEHEEVGSTYSDDHSYTSVEDDQGDDDDDDSDNTSVASSATSSVSTQSASSRSVHSADNV